MRLPTGLLALSIVAVLSGCHSSPDDLLPVSTSNETTSAIPRPAASIPNAGGNQQAVAQRPVQQAPQAASQDAMTPPQELALAATQADPQPMLLENAAPADAMPAARPVSFSMPQDPSGLRHERSRMKIYSQRFRDAKPINFGHHSPRAYQVHGVDVSRWQGNIDWDKLREQGANFAFIKATDGGDHVDPMFSRNWRASKASGLKRGAYHFFYWCRTAGEQADWFISKVPRDPEALPPVIDVEWNHDSACRQHLSPQRVREKMQVFMEKIERHYGRKPVIYTSPDFYEANLRGAFNNYPFWLRSVAAHPSKTYPGRRWVFWQYSGSGLSHGVEGRIDLNTFNGSAEEWHRWVAGL